MSPVLMVVLGITFGAVLGLVTNLLLIYWIERDQAAGREPVIGIGAMFFFRYIFDAMVLVGLWWFVRNNAVLIAATFSLTLSVKITILWYYLRKGGRIQ